MKLIIKSKKTSLVKEELYSSENQLSERIKRIKVQDMKNNLFYLEKTEQIKMFLKNNYKEDFFEESNETFQLLPLKNGVRRSLKMKSSLKNNELILSKSIERTQRDLNKSNYGISFFFKTHKMNPKERFETLVVETSDEMFGEEKGECILEFDKENWTFEIKSATAPRIRATLSHLYKHFNLNISHTRNFRKHRG